jgi:hypothetical protein
MAMSPKKTVASPLVEMMKTTAENERDIAMRASKRRRLVLGIRKLNLETWLARSKSSMGAPYRTIVA